MINVIFISVGHWKSNTWLEDNGASSGWLIERTLNIKIADRLVKLLENSWLEIILIWWENDRMSRNEKVSQINVICNNRWYTLDNSLCLEIHINAWWWTWNEILTYVDYPFLKELWISILDKMSEHTWLRNRGLKNWDWYTMINSTIPASMIIENSFLDTDIDRDILINRIETFSSWIYDWLKEYLWFEEIKLEPVNPLESTIIKLEQEIEKLKSDIEILESVNKRYYKIIKWVNKDTDID